MYKYTYILSESYRQNTPFLTHTPIQHRQQLLNTQTNFSTPNHHRQRISSSTLHHNKTNNQNYAILRNNEEMRRTKMASSVPKFSYQIDNNKLLQSHKNFTPHCQETQPQYTQLVKNAKIQNQLQDTFVKLNNLGQRHNQALRQVELQNKLKSISVKYKQQNTNNQIRDSLYNNYKMGKQATNNQTKTNYHNQLKQQQRQTKISNTLNNVYSFNTLPQPPQTQLQQQRKVNLRYDYNRPAPQTNPSAYGNQNGITRKQVKKMISTHLSAAKLDRQLFNQKVQSSKQTFTRDRDRKLLTDSTNYQNSGNQAEKGKMAVQKLSSLQERIKSSIKPYLNI